MPNSSGSSLQTVAYNAVAGSESNPGSAFRMTKPSGVGNSGWTLGVCPSNRSAKLLAANLSRISRHGEDLP
jgi:hypothetical protein